MQKVKTGLAILITSLCLAAVTNAQPQSSQFNYVLVSKTKFYLWKPATGAPVLTASLVDDKWELSPPPVAQSNEWQAILRDFSGNTPTEKWTDLLQRLSKGPGQVKWATMVTARTYAYVVTLSNQLVSVIFERYKNADLTPEQTWTYFFQNDESTQHLWSRRIPLNAKPEIGTNDILGLSDGDKEALAALFHPTEGVAFSWDRLWSDWINAFNGREEHPIPYQQKDGQAALFWEVPLSQQALLDHIKRPVPKIEVINVPSAQDSSIKGIWIAAAIGLVLGLMMPTGIRLGWRRLQKEPGSIKSGRSNLPALKRVRFHSPITFALAAPSPADHEEVKKLVREFLRAIKERTEEHERSRYASEIKRLTESATQPDMTQAKLTFHKGVTVEQGKLNAAALEMCYLIQERVLDRNFDDLVDGLFKYVEREIQKALDSGSNAKVDTAEDQRFLKLGEAVSKCVESLRGRKSELHHLYPGRVSEEEWIEKLPQAMSEVEQNLADMQEASSLGEIAQAALTCFKKLKDSRAHERLHNLCPDSKSELVWFGRLPDAVKEVEQKLSTQQGRIAELERSISPLKQEVQDGKKELREKEVSIEAVLRRENSLTLEKTNLQRHNTELQEQLKGKEIEAREFRIHQDGLQGRIKTLEKEREDMLSTYSNLPTQFMELQLTFRLADALTEGQRSYLGGNSDMVSAGVAFFLIDYSLVQLCRAIVNRNEQMKTAMYANLRLIARKLPASRRNASGSFAEALNLLPSSNTESIDETQDRRIPRRDGALFSALLAHLRGEPRVELAPFYFLGDSGAILRAS